MCIHMYADTNSYSEFDSTLRPIDQFHFVACTHMCKQVQTYQENHDSCYIINNNVMQDNMLC